MDMYVCAFFRRTEGHFLNWLHSSGRAAGSRKQPLNSLLRNYTMESNHPEQCSLISSAERLDHPQGACVPQAPWGSGLAPLLFHPPCSCLDLSLPTILTTTTRPQPTTFFMDQCSDGEGEVKERRRHGSMALTGLDWLVGVVIEVDNSFMQLCILYPWLVLRGVLGGQRFDC